MKKNCILFALAFLTLVFAYAAPPTASSSNLSFNAIEGKSFSGALTAGNGANRIVVVKEGGPVVGLPVNGVQYTPSSQFGTAGTEFTAPGEYVVARTSWSSFNVDNLKPNTVYHVAVFEVNGSGTASEYLMLPLKGQQATVTAPTAQATLVTSPSGTGNTLNLTWTKGNGAGRTAVARKGAPVNALPTDLTFFWGDETFGSGPKLGTDNYVVYKGAGSSTTVKNLEPNTRYHFAVFEYNGSSQPVHLAPGAAGTGTTEAGPSVAPSSVGLSAVEGDRMTVGFTQGNGTRRLVIARKNAPVTAVPVNGTAYMAATFGVGTEIAPGEFVVASVTGTSAVVTGLLPNTTYHFRVFEFDRDVAGNTYYLTSAFASKSGSTATPPTVLATNVRLSASTGTGATIAFTPGNGGYRMLLLKEGGDVSATPANLISYSNNSNFGSGTALGNGNFASHWGTNGVVFNVASLLPGKTYHAMLYEFNGYHYPVYSAGVPFVFSMPLQPTVAASNFTAGYADAGQMRLTWTSGNGTKRIVVARKGSYVASHPTDGVNYNANAGFGLGQEMAPGEFVVYNGNSTYFDVTNLELATTYHFAVFEYNANEAGEPDYLTTHPAVSGTTAGTPVTQLTLSAASAIQPASATLNFTKGSGESRVFFMSEHDMQSFLPADYVKYSNNTYGSSAAHVGGGVYCVNNTTGNGSFSVSGLKANTKYYVRAFEYNGTTSPAYQRTPIPATSFTTADVPGATTPTVPATNGETDNADGNKFTLKWSKGNGEKRIVVLRKAAPVNFVPADATAYNANASFAAGTDLGSGQYVVYNGSGTSVDVTGLQPSETYFVMVYEYNGSDALLRYLTSAKLAFTGSTVFAPTTPVSNVAAVAGNGTLTLNWTPGNGAGRLVVVKEGSAPAAQPADLSVYPFSTAFKNGSQMAAGEYVVYVGSGAGVTITGLSNNRYHYAIFEYNGNTAPVYNRSGVAGSAVVGSTLPVSLVAFAARQAGNGVVLNWTTAQEVGSSHFVIERSVDGRVYEARGTVQSAGNSAVRKDYAFTDAGLVSGKLYYRLKQVDGDGKAVYSSVETVDVNKPETGLAVYPNPVVSGFAVRLPNGLKQANARVYDMSGALRLTRTVKEGERIDVSHLGKGSYAVSIEQEGKTYATQFAKQ